MAAGYPAVVYQHKGVRRARDLTVGRWNQLGDEMEAVQKTLGLRPHRGYADVAARFAAIETLVKNAQGALVNLTTGNNATTPASKIDIAWDLLSIQGQLVANFSQTLDCTGTGINKLDTGALSNGNWYHFFAGYNPTTLATGVLASLQSDEAAISAKPSGYTRWRRIGSMFYTSSAFYRYFQLDHEVLYETLLSANTHRVLQNGASTTMADVVCTSHCPPGSRLARIAAVRTATSTAGNYVVISRKGGAELGGYPLVDAGTNASIVASGDVDLDSSQTFRYKWTGNPGGTAQADLHVLGYYDPRI